MENDTVRDVPKRTVPQVPGEVPDIAPKRMLMSGALLLAGMVGCILLGWGIIGPLVRGGPTDKPPSPQASPSLAASGSIRDGEPDAARTSPLGERAEDSNIKAASTDEPEPVRKKARRTARLRDDAAERQRSNQTQTAEKRWQPPQEDREKDREEWAKEREHRWKEADKAREREEKQRERAREAEQKQAEREREYEKKLWEREREGDKDREKDKGDD